MTYKPSDIRENGIRVLRSSNINEDRFILKDDDIFVSKQSVNIDFVKENDILITAANGSSKLVGKHAILSNIANNSTVHGGFMLIASTTEPHFINAYMGASWYKKFINLYVAGGNGAIGNLNKNDLDNQEILIPSEYEQKKIGLYFSQLDNLITLHQRKGQVYKYFFTIVWEQRKLMELAIINPKEELPNEFEYVDLESVVGTKMLFHRTEKKATAPSRAQRLASTGDLFYQTVRPYQKNNYLFEKSDKYYVFSTGYAQLRPFIDGYFLLSLVQNEWFVKTVLENCTGTSYPAINSSDLAEIRVFYSKDRYEQYQIGVYFRNLDRLITLHQWKCNAYEKNRVIAKKQRKLEIILINLQKYTFLRVILVYKQWIIICIYYENILLRFYVVINVKVIFLFIIIFENIAIIYKLSCVFSIYYSHLFLFMYEINIIAMRVLILQNILFRKFTMNQVAVIKYLFTCVWFIIYYSKKYIKITFVFIEIIILVTKER